MIGLCIVGVVLVSFSKSMVAIIIIVSKICYRKLRKWVHFKLNYNKWQKINKTIDLANKQKEIELKMILKAIKGYLDLDLSIL